MSNFDRKVLAISSIGGHWVQLLRLTPAFKDVELVFVTTRESFKSMVPNYRFFSIPDGNRNDLKGLFASLIMIHRIICEEKPDVIITTGAAPGLLAIIIGKLKGIKTIWVDSIANCEELSLSGRIASKFADKVYTQWEHLKTDKINYEGNVLG